MIDPATREKAAQICDAASENTEISAQHYAKTAESLGFNVRYRKDTDDGEGADMEAVELAARAWLAVDPEPHGIESSADPKRDNVAANMLRDGWTPPEMRDS